MIVLKEQERYSEEKRKQKFAPLSFDDCDDDDKYMWIRPMVIIVPLISEYVSWWF